MIPHILLKAHEISPFRGSECSNGWNYVVELSKHVNLTVIYAETNQFGTVNYKNEIEKEQLNQVVEFIAIPQPLITRLISKINRFFSGTNKGTGISALYFIGVFFWERKVYIYLKNKDIDKFHILHNLNHVSFREPSFLWKFDKPFVWGPTSGTGNVPLKMIKGFSMRSKLMVILRNYSNHFQQKFSRRISSAAIKASKIFYVSLEDEFFFKKYNKQIKFLPDVTIEESFLKNLSNKKSSKIELIWVGRIDPLKSLGILLEVFKTNVKFKDHFNITVVGDGLLKSECMDFCKTHNITNIKWLGQINRTNVKDEILKSDLLVHTSIKEASATVIMEALSLGTPVVCHDAFGMAKVINEEIGFKIPYSSQEASVRYLTQILQQILENPKILESKSNMIKIISKQFTKENVIKEILTAYEDIINSL